VKARERVAAVLAASMLGVLLGACGTGLHDAEGVPLLEESGLTCDESTQVECSGVCTEEDASHCGSSCLDCTGGSVPTGAVAACVRAGGASGACGYECADGLLRCAAGCCPATAVAAGDRFTYALASDGSVSCWGTNASGQLGDGSTASRAFPGAAGLPAAAVAIGAGARHACAVMAAGSVLCWGSNDAGQITGSAGASVMTSSTSTPVAAGAVAVVAGDGHTCARLESGAVRCWGAAVQAGGGTPIASGSATTALAAGRAHTCAVVSGAVRCWGANEAGQLGSGSTAASASPVDAIASGIGAAPGLLAAGWDQTCAATGASSETEPHDAIRCWGDSVGEAYLFSSPQLTPAIPRKDVNRATIEKVVQLVAAGRRHVCVSDRGEAVECFGANDRGQLGGTPTGPGEAATVPLPAAPPAAIATALAAGADHTCAVVSGGRLRCWGANDAGQLGNGSTTDPGTGSVVAPLGR